MNYEKAKAYDKALKRAKDILFGSTDTSQSVTKEIIEDIFPELAQSEDERIRKALIFYLGDMPEDTELRNGVTNRDVFAWLEKQGEKDKPTYNIYSKDVQLTQEEYNKKRASDEATIKEVEAYKKGLEDAQKIFEKQGESYTKRDVDDAYLEGMVFAKNELEKQGEYKSPAEVLKIRQELYQSGYNDGYKHGCEDTKKKDEKPKRY